MYGELIKRLRNESKYALPSQTRKALIEAADTIEQLSNAGSAYGRGWTLGYDAGREESKQRWIPVTERLPEINTWVLAYCKYKDLVIDYVDKNGLWSYGNVTHWMPKPEPPKEGTE